MLSHDAWTHVGRFLERRDVLSLLLVCKRTMTAMETHATFHSLDFKSESASEALMVLGWRRFRQLRHLGVSGSVTDACLALVAALPQLTSLAVTHIAPGMLSKHAFAVLRGNTRLVTLRINNCSAAREDAMRDLCELPNLREVHLSALMHTEPTPYLEFLRAHAARLTHLSLRKLSSLHDVVPLTESTSSEAEEYNATAATPIIATMRNLVHLDLHTSQWLTQRGLELILPELKHLSFLNLSWTGVNDASLQHLPPTVRQLSLNRTIISDQGCEYIGRLHELESLRLNLCSEVGNAGLMHITRGCLQLKNLELQKCRGLTDAGVVTICELQCIESLDLYGVGIDDVTVPAVVRLLAIPSLKKVRLPWQHAAHPDVKEHPSVVR